MTEPGYWTWEQIQAFCIEHDLVIATGTAGEDDVALTGKGIELLALLEALAELERREKS